MPYSDWFRWVSWNCTRGGRRGDRLDRPDRLTFDLDPDPTVPWTQVVESARLTRTLLEELDLVCFLKTTGGKGLHVVVPIQRSHDWDEVKAFAKAVADHMVAAIPPTVHIPTSGEACTKRENLHRLPSQRARCDRYRRLFSKSQAWRTGFRPDRLGGDSQRRHVRPLHHHERAGQVETVAPRSMEGLRRFRPPIDGQHEKAADEVTR